MGKCSSDGLYFLKGHELRSAAEWRWRGWELIQGVSRKKNPALGVKVCTTAFIENVRSSQNNLQGRDSWTTVEMRSCVFKVT